ncbi:hypothetical protein VTN96DRAFT_9934 [Rasamsonia emersonii]
MKTPSNISSILSTFSPLSSNHTKTACSLLYGPSGVQNFFSVCARVRTGTAELKGSVVCVQSLDQLARKPSAVHPLQPLMNFSSVAAWTSAGAGMVTLACRA